MELKRIIDDLFQEGLDTSSRILSGFAQAEKFLQQAYEGRYLFELIQNVRDANKEVGKDGNVILSLEKGVLSVLNSGAEFSADGIRSITTIGDSTKESQDYIGFKGIGFKSVQEISDSPKIVTLYGTVVFDRILTNRKLAHKELDLEQTPLFLLPNYSTNRLSDSEIRDGYVTQIDLPLRDGIDEGKVIRDFCQIGVEQLVLLGNLRLLELRSKDRNIKYYLNKNNQRNFVEVKTEGKKTETTKFRVYSPKEPTVVPQNVVSQLEGKEKRIFSSGGSVDISVCLEISDAGHFQPVEKAKLYLFYPLKISSGFRFLIHSYFIVNPERTALRNSPLNDFLLNQIGKFIGGELLHTLRKRGYNASRILAFQRISDSGLESLYDAVVEELEQHKFIYDRNRYYRPNEVIVADGIDRGLFPNGKLRGKHLIYVEDDTVRNWLRTEFDVAYLSSGTIAEEIEEECRQQAKANKLDFFQNLYNYINAHPNLNLVGRKVLITDDWKLVSSEDDVFYGGGRRSPLKLSRKIRSQIHLIHSGITISDFRDGKSRTGIVEFNTHELVKRVLRLFENEKVSKEEILTALFNAELDAKSMQELREHVLLPVKSTLGRRKWVKPLKNAVLVDTAELREMYPDVDFADEEAFRSESLPNAEREHEFLRACGAWHIPPVYVSPSTSIPSNGKRDSVLSSIVNLRARPLTLTNDRKLEIPKRFNQRWTRIVIDNWTIYREFITSNSLPRPYFYSSQSDPKGVPTSLILRASSFLSTLRKQKWIALNDNEEPFGVDDVVGIEPAEFHLPHFQVVKKYLRLLPISYSANKDFIETVGLTHLSAESVDTFSLILKRIHKKYSDDEIVSEREFVSFYNRVLGKLFEYYLQHRFDDNNVRQLQNLTFLARDEQTGKLIWTKSAETWYIDDKPNYDLLPAEVKKRIQPQFTNRDKQTFGKVAVKLGKRFSKKVRRTLINSEILNTILLSEFVPSLPECLALVEAQLDLALSREIEVFRNIRVVTHEQIRIEVRIEEDEATEVPATHFIEDSPRYDIHLAASSNASQNKLISLAISEVFIKLLEREVGKLAADLSVFLNEANKSSHLLQYEVSEERILEIRNLLKGQNLSPDKVFWNAILLAKETFNDQALLSEVPALDEITTLANRLGIPTVDIELFNRTFDFQISGNPSNIEPLFRLLSQLGISLTQINNTLFPRISFRDYYSPKLEALRNRIEPIFNERLYLYLATKDLAEQERYQDKLDRYRNFPLITPSDAIKLDVTEFLWKSMKGEFLWLELAPEELENKGQTFDDAVFYKKHHRALSRALRAIKGSSAEKLERFLALNSRRSLLYFAQWRVLIERFERWLATQPQDATVENKTDLAKILGEAALTDDEEIEYVDVGRESASSNGSGTHGYSGSRWDGAGNEDQKKLVGIVAEYVVFQQLAKKYKKVVWMSKNASKVPPSTKGYNPEGDDSLGYDIEYLDGDGNKFFVEVKARSDDTCAFEITQKEIEKAKSAKTAFKLIFVTNPLEPSRRRFRDLGNLFYSIEPFDFFSNSRFLVLNKSFEIRFKEIETSIE